MTVPLLQLQNLRIAYPSRRTNHATKGSLPPNWAVDGISLSLFRGERLGLVGESGCGKSTLGRAIMRLLPPTSLVEGSILFNEEPVIHYSPERLRRFRGECAALVFQDPMTRLNPVMTIGNHCLETLRSHLPHLSRREAKLRAIATLETVKIPGNRWHQYPHEFSGGMRQRVAMALALLLNPQLMIADEPTTSLDVTVAAQILQELTRLCQERNMGLLLISHDLALVSEYCNTLVVMHKGQIVEQGSTVAILQQPQHPYTQSLLQSALGLRKGERTPPPNSTPPAAPLLKLEQLSVHFTLESNPLTSFFSIGQFTFPAVDGVNLSIQPGEVLGLVGESGCGKSTLSRAILQLLRPTSGRVQLGGLDLTKLNPKALRRQRPTMQMIFQDPHACLNPMMTVGENITEPFRIQRLASPQVARSEALKLLERVGLTPPDAVYHCYPSKLSGGQQQRVAIARAIITRPQLLICDEPVSMLDATIQSQVLELMLDLRRELNLTYLFITHDLWVARLMCDRIAVMQAGKILEWGDTDSIFNHPHHPYTQALINAAPRLLTQFPVNKWVQGGTVPDE